MKSLKSLFVKVAFAAMLIASVTASADAVSAAPANPFSSVDVQAEMRLPKQQEMVIEMVKESIREWQSGCQICQ